MRAAPLCLLLTACAGVGKGALEQTLTTLEEPGTSDRIDALVDPEEVADAAAVVGSGAAEGAVTAVTDPAARRELELLAQSLAAAAVAGAMQGVDGRIDRTLAADRIEPLAANLQGSLGPLIRSAAREAVLGVEDAFAERVSLSPPAWLLWLVIAAALLAAAALVWGLYLLVRARAEDAEARRAHTAALAALLERVEPHPIARRAPADDETRAPH